MTTSLNFVMERKCQMPIDNYESCCEKYAKRIVSKDVGEPKHVGNNPKLCYVTHYRKPTQSP